MKEKNITINDLAVMVKKGFDGIDRRFDMVDDRLERIAKPETKPKEMLAVK